jgi:outer membrane protein assembly factor BamB
LHCLDVKNGQVVWKRNLAQTYQVQESDTYSSPLIEADKLILSIGGKPSASVLALDKRTGQEIWKALDDPACPSSPIVISAGGIRQLIVWTPRAVTSLNPMNGRIYWREVFAINASSAVATPVFDRNRLLISGLMLAVHADRPAASLSWPRQQGVSRRVLNKFSTPWLSGDYVYSANATGELVCLNASSGATLWTTNTVTPPGPSACIHIIGKGTRVFLFTDQGELIRASLSAAGYEEKGRVKLLQASNNSGKQSFWSPPAYSRGCVFVRDDRELVCFSLTSRHLPGSR